MRLFETVHAPTTDDWYTPPWVFEDMKATFDMDVAAPPGGVPWIPALRSFSEEDDGLAQEWTGFVWCNPPYSKVKPWALKWASHGNGILLIPADLSTSGPLAAFFASTSMFVPEGRMRFVNGHGEAKSSPNFTAILLGVGALADKALVQLQVLGRGFHRSLL